MSSEQWGTRLGHQKASPYSKWQRGNSKGGQQPVIWEEHMKNKCWRNISYRNKACNTWIPEDMRQFLARTYTAQRAYKCDLEITRNFATYPLQRARPGCRGREEETGPPTPLPKQRQNSPEEKEDSERRWGVRVLQEADSLSKWHDDEQTEQKPVDRKLMGTGH